MNKQKIAILAILALILAITAMFIYRMFFTFDNKKVKAMAEAEANNTGNPKGAFALLNESIQMILKSQDLTHSVKVLAEVSGISKEKALVLTALNNCYSLGFIAPPQTITEEDDQAI